MGATSYFPWSSCQSSSVFPRLPSALLRLLWHRGCLCVFISERAAACPVLCWPAIAQLLLSPSLFPLPPVPLSLWSPLHHPPKDSDQWIWLCWASELNMTRQQQLAFYRPFASICPSCSCICCACYNERQFKYPMAQNKLPSLSVAQGQNRSWHLLVNVGKSHWPKIAPMNPVGWVLLSSCPLFFFFWMGGCLTAFS